MSTHTVKSQPNQTTPSHVCHGQVKLGRATHQTVISLPLRALSPHPANPNRMSEAAFNKLVKHIERSGQYEPIVVRPHPQRANGWQILNGHHRVRALGRLNHTHADCVVFRADDIETLVYLATLNGLTGRDNVHKKCRLMEQLCQHCGSRELSRRLPQSRAAIEKLDGMARQQPLPKPAPGAPLLLPMTFFLTEPQHRLISEAFERAVSETEFASRSEKRLTALCRIAKDYLGKDVF